MVWCITVRGVAERGTIRERFDLCAMVCAYRVMLRMWCAIVRVEWAAVGAWRVMRHAHGIMMRVQCVVERARCVVVYECARCVVVCVRCVVVCLWRVTTYVWCVAMRVWRVIVGARRAMRYV